MPECRSYRRSSLQVGPNNSSAPKHPLVFFSIVLCRTNLASEDKPATSQSSPHPPSRRGSYAKRFYFLGIGLRDVASPRDFRRPALGLLGMLPVSPAVRKSRSQREANVNRNFATCWISFVICIVMSPLGHAAPVFSNIAEIVTDGVFNAGQICNTGSSGSLVTCSVNGYLGPFANANLNATSTAFGDASGLHATASEGIHTLGAPAGSLGVITQAQSSLQDFFRFGGQSGSAYVNMTITTHGASSGGASHGYTQLDLINVGSSTGECFFNNAGNCTVHMLFNLATGFREVMELFALADVEGINGAGDFSAFATFSDTAFISSLLFTDLNGNPLNLTYTTDSGLTYPMPQPVNGIPEPSTIVLLGLGIAALGSLQRRKIRCQAAGHPIRRQIP